ncbi:hypothetical protein KR084_009894 [Drosophila pseudotakahashii]|nr:hypothetical protein KR084_009894 [Drosophila pseudotakahashii]
MANTRVSGSSVPPGGGKQKGVGKGPLGSGRGNRPVSFQDIHSAATKRRFKHVISPVAKYMAEMRSEDERRRIERLSSMSESQKPISSQSESEAHSQTNNPSYTEKELLAVVKILENDRMKFQDLYDDVQRRLEKKGREFLQTRGQVDILRIELSDCQQKLKREQSRSPRSLNFWPPALMAKATQTDSGLDSTDFRSVGTQANEGEILADETYGNSTPREPAIRAPAPNNSEISQPSSDDSAIEVGFHEEEGHEEEGHEEESPLSRQWIQRHQRGTSRSSKSARITRITVSAGAHVKINDSQAQLVVHSNASDGTYTLEFTPMPEEGLWNPWDQR